MGCMVYHSSFFYRLKFQFKSVIFFSSHFSQYLGNSVCLYLMLCRVWVGAQCAWRCEGVGVQADYGWVCLLPVTLQRLSYSSCCGRWSVTRRVPLSSDQLSQPDCPRNSCNKSKWYRTTQNTGAVKAMCVTFFKIRFTRNVLHNF